MEFPYLVQRIHLRNPPDNEGKGIDAFFSFDYMGAAEFEFGTLFLALKSMRFQLERYPENPIRLKLKNGDDTRVAWFVGPVELKELAHSFFNDQSFAKNRSIRLKEATYMHEAYEPIGPEKFIHVPIGWWALDQEVPWLIFTKKVNAKKWLTHMKGTK